MRFAPVHGLRPRMVVVFLLVAALSSLITAALTFHQARSSILDRTQKGAVNDLRLQVDSLVPNLPSDPTDADLRVFARQLDLASGSRGWHTAVSRAGGPLIGTASEVSGSLRAAVKSGSSTFYERVAGPGEPRLFIGMPVNHTDLGATAEKQSGLVVYAVVSLDREQADVSALITAAWAGAVPALVLAVLPALFAARRVLRPVGRLRAAAEKITRGDLDTRLDVNGSDELAALTNTFNTMAARLQHDDAELRRMEANARRFASDVSHELRTPLAAMVAVTDALDDDARTGGLPPDTADAVRLISDETRKLVVMVEDLMEISRFDAGAATLQQDEVSLHTLIHKTLQLRGWPAPAKVLTELPAHDARIRIDSRRIDIVLANLIGNALKHGAAPVTVRATVGQDAVVITVADRGPGIPDQVLPHVFDRFYKADAARSRSEGSGLGLAIARENVRLHDGSLTAANLPEGGAVFTIVLPHRPAKVGEA
ncbi:MULTISPECIES: sensor histidine kinase [unclassified Streptomyces]|jgi:two-component system sensor histidine kinase MtrB|uniref:sensor histidine kinase n=1 Tax=unclassified Streptomyces TaxID=2593676 RepID=UPI000D380B43|nr:HAMP domain-containing sensor histidine kinase [Streptomyces sp. VMFN-G11Ma]PTM86544.1 two-component system sensor histidine kinase MtrB [Streptomyces sp. VMFN-G11Ma]